MAKQRHGFLGLLETYPPKCGGQLDDGSGVCMGRLADHELPTGNFLAESDVRHGKPLTIDDNTGKVRARKGTDTSVMLGHAGEKISAGDVIWLFNDEQRIWKVKCLAPTHMFTPIQELNGRCGGVSEGGGLCGMEERLHIKPAITGEKNPYVAIEIRRLKKNLMTDHRAAVKFAAEYAMWATLKESSEKNRVTCRQHAQVWQARAHALQMALEGLK